MKIVLTTSPKEGETVLNCNPKYVLNEFIKYPPLNLLSILRNVKPEHEVKLYDANEYSYDELLQNIINERPDLFSISCVTERFYGVSRLIKDIKKNLPNTTIICGGPHTDLYPIETMSHKEFDYMIVGPGEITFPMFVDWLNNKDRVDRETIDNLYYRDRTGALKNTRLRTISNLDEYPLPDRKRIDLKHYVSLSDRRLMTTMSSSRGCPFRCVFCNVPHYYMTSSAQRIVTEIEEILDLGFNEIYILDDTFNINHQRVMDICSSITKKGLKFRWSTRARLNPFDDEIAAAMKESGCFRLSVGVESHNPEILKYTKKGVTKEQIIKGFEIIHKYDFESLAYFMIGFPGQTIEDAWATMDFIKIIKPSFILMNSLLALPHSAVYFDLLKRGVFQKDYWKEYVLNPVKDYVLPSWRGDDMDKSFMDIRDQIMKRFYLSPGFVLKETYGDITNYRFKQLGRKIKMGFKLLRGAGE